MISHGRVFVERENEILRIIRSFTNAYLEFVVVGGYTLSGLGRHRFSVNLDVVIEEKDLEAFTGSWRKGISAGTSKEVAPTRFTEANLSAMMNEWTDCSSQ